ncbi:hypothetical protein [Ferrovum sp.]|uniref:Kae1-like domain-containing protein n=1 Tax=Ferrovum sp. TaxID=2609467 RepID=UPI002625468A|nr:hypothetical protein [Ferrovum sp.]
MLQRRLNCVATSSMGRLFDLLGVSKIQGYEGQAAMLLEGLAEQRGKAVACGSRLRNQPRWRAGFIPSSRRSQSVTCFPCIGNSVP